MSSGVAALIELMSVGKQNKVLNANPQITFWRFTHMRYTDFSLEQVKVDGNVSKLTGSPQTIHFDLPRSGDLVNNAFVVFHLPGLANYVSSGGEKAEGKSWHARLAKVSAHNDEDATNATGSVAGSSDAGECVESASVRGARKSTGCVCGPEPYYIDSVGQYLCDEIRLQVGSQIVDTVYSHYLKMWDEISNKPGHGLSSGYGQMAMKGSRDARIAWSRRRRSVFVPLNMFFMRTSGNALPLIALSFHGVKVTLKTKSFDKAIQNTLSGNDKTVVREEAADKMSELIDLTAVDGTERVVSGNDVMVNLSVGYVYLGVAERNKFAEASFEILIDQVQKGQEAQVKGQTKTTIDNIGFNHCVQELLWATTSDASSGDPDGALREPMEYRGEMGNDLQYLDTLSSCQLKLNNSKRFTHLDGDAVPSTYFRQMEPYLHHTRVPETAVYSYSFAITPESNQPSGSANFSRIDNASFEVTGNFKSARTGSLHMYARNWNVFRISLGLGGLVWAS